MKRQNLTSIEGVELQRQYIYLPKKVWNLLQDQARQTHDSVSQLIEKFANSGTANSQEINGTGSE